jgi:aryl-alcohol dehydrogenase-like predicted oxidoreductase
VSRGEIRAYGCATWTAFRVPPGAKTHLSIQDLVHIAHEVAGEHHHFRAIQLPINLAMAEAVRTPTQPLGGSMELVPAVQAAASLGLSVFASASLMQSQLARDLPQEMRALFPLQRTDAQRALAFVQSMPGVTSALVGTRSRQHVMENLEGAHRADAALR